MERLKMIESQGWSTINEQAAIAFMASDKARSNGSIPSKIERIAKLQTWLKHARTRRWPQGVNVGRCIFSVQKELDLLGVSYE